MKLIKALSMVTLSFISLNSFAVEVVCGHGESIPLAVKDLNSQLSQKQYITISAPVYAFLNVHPDWKINMCVSVNEKV
ncbi:MAG: hypothetical protein H0U70_11825 [Tatlockia sp.]|nr:hypothetical protein [Tatlockia sp.]